MSIKPIFTIDATKPIEVAKKQDNFLEKGPNGELGHWTINGGDDVYFTPVKDTFVSQGATPQAAVKGIEVSRSGLDKKADGALFTHEWFG